MVEDAALRNPVIAGARYLLGRQPDQTHTDPTTGETFTYRSPGGQMVDAERERRDRYELEAQADGWRQARGGLGGQLAAGATNVTGAIVGAMADPTSIIGGPSRTVAGRVIGNAAINAAGDAGTQAADVGSELQDRYSPTQTLLAGAIGGVIQGGFEVAPTAGRLAVRGGRGAARFAGRGSQLVSDLIESGNTVPRFDTPALDTGALTPRGSVPSPLGTFGQPNPARPVSAPESRPSAGVVFAAPVAGPVSSGFGPRIRPNRRASANHQGVDFAVAEGTPVAASADGEVIFAGPRGNYGNRVVIRHADGSETAYSHLSGFDVRVGDSVRTGQAVARSGSTGNVTGPHLHFEIRKGGGYVDPRPLLNGEAPRAPRGPDDRGDRQTLAERLDQQRPIRATAPTAERLSPDPLIERFPNTRPEEAALAREAVLDPAASARLRAMLGERLPTGRAARNFTRELIHAARRNPLPEQPAPARLAAMPEGEPSPVFRAEDTPDGFRVFQEGRLRDVPMLWGRREGNDLRLESTALPPDMQGQGFGVEVYTRAADAAAERGGRLLSDNIVRPQAANVYEALARRGYLVTRDPEARMASGAWEAPNGRPVFTVERPASLNPAKPLTPAGGEAPARLAARVGGETGQAAPRFAGRGRRVSADGSPVAPRFKGEPVPERLAVDMTGYADRIGQTVQSSGQGVGGLRDAPRPDAVARGSGAAFGGKSVSDLAADLRSALGLTHRQGRVGARGALGTYDTGSGVVRTKAVDELDVLAHEATHALEYELKGPALAAALRKHSAHLKTLAYPGAGQAVKRQEGFAEFGRWYLTNPDHARRIAPDFFNDFEAAMAKDASEVLAGMKAVQGGYQNLLSSASIDVAKGSIAYTGSKGPIGNLIDEVRRTGPGSTLRRVVDDIYTAVMDDLHPLAVAERKLSALYLANNGQKLDLKRAASPYALSRLSREAYAAGHNDLMNGVVPYQGLDPVGASLADALETAGLARSMGGTFKPDATREFDAYLISRRAVHLWDRYAAGDLPNPPDRNTKAFHQQVIADAESANPTWSQAAGQVYEFLTNLWKKERDAGLITGEAYDNGLTHTDYVPFNRDMSDKGPGGKGGKPRGALQFAGGVKQLEGSSRDIISPLSSIMRRSYELNAIIKRNDVMKALDDMAEAAGRGSGAVVERLPAKEIEAFTVNAADALNKTAEEMGLSGRDLTTMQKFADDAASADAKVTLFKQTEFSPRKGEAVVFVWRDGKKTPLLLADGEFGQQMFTALSGMNKELRNVVVDSMAAATQLLRYGVTLSPEFMAANIIRDSLATWINTDVGFVPGLDTIRGGALEMAQGQTAKRYAVAGGMRGGANTAATQKPFPHTDAEAEAQLQHLRRKGWKVKRYASWRGLAELTDLSETSTRLGVFKKGFDQAKARGLTDYEAMIESGFTSRDYLDFARRGSKMLTASRVVTFLNAALQGLDKSTRVLTAGGNLKALLTPLDKGARTSAEKRALGHAYKAWAKIATLGALGLGLRMLYADDPEYQEINDRLRATHWIAKIGGRWIFVPKPFELATISNILERAYEGTALNDPTAGERLLSDFRHTIAPPSEIPAVAVPFNIASNRDYLGRPIVPDHLRGTVEPELQFNSFTSDLGKLIGRTFNVSPAVVDYVITGFGGSLGRYVLQGSNLIGEAVTGRPRTAAGPEDMFLARRFTRSIARGSDSQSEFWDNVSKDGGEMTRAEGTFRALQRDAKDAEAAAYLNRLPPAQRAYVVAKVFSEDGESVMHPLVRTQKAISAIGDFRSEVRSGDLRDGQGQVIELSPQDRRAIDNAVGDFALAEMRNALIDTGVRGWAQRDRMDPTAALRRIYAVSPEAYSQLGIRLANEKAATAFHPIEQQRRQGQWAEYRDRLERPADPRFVTDLLRRRRATNGDRASRYQEAQRRAGGAYAPAPSVNALQPSSQPQPRFPRNALAGG